MPKKATISQKAAASDVAATTAAATSKEAEDDVKYGCGMFTGENTRHWALAILLQIGLRIRYFFDTFFLLTPLFDGALTGYKSNFRPAKCPDYDYVTHMGFKWITILTAFSRYNRLSVGHMIYHILRLALIHF